MRDSSVTSTTAPLSLIFKEFYMTWLALLAMLHLNAPATCSTDMECIDAQVEEAFERATFNGNEEALDWGQQESEWE